MVEVVIIMVEVVIQQLPCILYLLYNRHVAIHLTLTIAFKNHNYYYYLVYFASAEVSLRKIR